MPCYSDMIKATSWSVYVFAECEEDDRRTSGLCETGFYKIGSARSVSGRLSTLITGNPRRLVSIFEHDLGSRNAAIAVEKLAHRMCDYEGFRVRKTEWFQSTQTRLIGIIKDAIAEVTPKLKHNGEYVERVAI